MKIQRITNSKCWANLMARSICKLGNFVGIVMYRPADKFPMVLHHSISRIAAKGPSDGITGHN